MQRKKSYSLFHQIFIMGMIFVFSALTISCGNSSNLVVNPIENTWYYGDIKASFYDDGTYDISMWNVYAWESVESGIYEYDSNNGELTIEITMDTNDRGFGSSVDETMTLSVPELSTDSMTIIDGEDDSLIFSLTEPNLPSETTIIDDFNDNSVNTNYWYVEPKDGLVADVVEADERLYISENYPPLRLRMAGYSSISVDMTATYSETRSNMAIKYKPFNSEFKAEMGYQNDWNGNLVIFGHVYGGDPYMWEVFTVINHDETYNIKMEWDGTVINFYIDDDWIHAYTPEPASIILPFPIDHRISTWDGNEDNLIEGYVDNFVVEE